MKVLLTGGNGYIGSNLLRKLIYSNYQVDLIVRPQSNLSIIADLIKHCNVYRFKGNSLEMVKIFKKSKPRVVIHLAAHSTYENCYGNIKNLIKSNILFGTQILEAMSSTSVNYLINTGSYWQHQKNLSYHPNSLYAATKESFQNIISFYTKTFPIKSITLKLFETYGPYDFRKKILPSVIEAMKTKKKIIMSPGDQLLDIVYISDVVDAYTIAMDILTSEKKTNLDVNYFISSKEQVRLKYFIEKFINIMNENIDIDWGGKPYRSREIMSPLRDVPILPSWKPKINLDKGLGLIKRSILK